jgi:hypothetical protein
MRFPFVRSGLALTALVLLLAGVAPSVRAQNLLVNPGFETGDFSGWTVGGNSTSAGVATDGASIAGASPSSSPHFVNLRSGSFAGFAVVRQGNTGPPPPTPTPDIERILLSQTVAVTPFDTLSIGFYLGNDASSGYGAFTGDDFLQIFVDGVGILPSDLLVVSPGSTPADFRFISGNAATGSRTSVNVTFAITGSGTARAGASFDDFFVNGVAPAAAVPEPGTLALLLVGTLTTGVGFLRRRGGSRTFPPTDRSRAPRGAPEEERNRE